jgi:hypothetical protein
MKILTHCPARRQRFPFELRKQTTEVPPPQRPIMVGPEGRTSCPSESGAVCPAIRRGPPDCHWRAGLKIPLAKICAIQVSPRVSTLLGTRAVSTPDLKRAIRVSIKSVPSVAHRPLASLEGDVDPAGSPETSLPPAAAADFGPTGIRVTFARPQTGCPR